MARKAVQGYTDKSFYDNTKFTGMIATHDPLQEGFFRHLVNLDISDTGQSLTPRKGYLTTGVIANGEYVSLSDQTVIFKDANTQQHIVYDFKYSRGFVVDISAYNITNYSMYATRTIDNFDWDDVRIYAENILEHLVGFEVKYEPFDGETTGVVLPISYLQNAISLRTTQTTPIRNQAGVLINVCKAVLATAHAAGMQGHQPGEDYGLYIGLYYRSEGSLGLPSNTLVVTVFDLSEQKSVSTHLRNLASDKSIIPDEFQVVYESGDEPDGFVNEFPIIYVKDINTSKYLLNAYQVPMSLKLVPHFNLVKSDQNNTSWAYAYDITKRQTAAVWGELDDDVLYRSDVYDLVTGNPVFTPVSLAALFKTDRSKIQNVPLITIVNRNLESPITIYSNGNPNEVTHILDLASESYNTANVVDSLYGRFSNVTDRDSLIAAIELISNDYIYHFNHYSDIKAGYSDTTGSFLSADFSDEIVSKVSKGYNDSRKRISNSYHTGTIDKKELIERIKLSRDTSYTFRFLPRATEVSIKDDPGGPFKHFPYKYNGTNIDPLPADPYATFFVYFGGAPYDLYESPNMFHHVTLDYVESSQAEDTIFDHVDNQMMLTLSHDSINPIIANLQSRGYFSEGVTLTIYLIQYTKFSHYVPHPVFVDTLITTAALINSVSISKSNTEPSTIIERLTREPQEIRNAKGSISFQGSRMVHWYNNTVYISEEGEPNYYIEDGKVEFDERIVKVIEFKTILLVFTVQHLYAVYETETELVPAKEAKTEDDIATEAVIGVVWAKQAVLYNIMASDKYADVIQVFNQMVLFYSEQGQMFMVKPNTMIDSETEFTLQYFNKAANDILLNYDVYINERLEQYNSDTVITKDQVIIKAQVSVSFIKIFYIVPGVITYILIYDVLNNRYSVYDTKSFTNVTDTMFVESGEMYLTTHNNFTYFTMPYQDIYDADSNCDMSRVTDYKKEPINALVDKGSFDFNNHLTKRILGMHLTYKNLSANKLLFNAEYYLDEIIFKPFYEPRVEVRNFTGGLYFDEVPALTLAELVEFIGLTSDEPLPEYVLRNFEEGNNLMLDFSKYNSSKLLTHRTSILGMGKVFGLKMVFISKGTYKIQNFGIVYKERRI